MCNGTIMDKLISFALPLMVSSILQLLFNAVDIIVVGRFTGSQALAAVGSTTALINMFVNLFIGVSLGANVLSARFYAAGKEREMSGTYGDDFCTDQRYRHGICGTVLCPWGTGTDGYSDRRDRPGSSIYENLFLRNAFFYAVQLRSSYSAGSGRYEETSSVPDHFGSC